MRESIGSTWVFSIVIVFTLIFSGFLVLVISYSKAYKIKNEMTSIIEKYEGLTSNSNNNNSNKMGSIEIINNYLLNSGYNTKGKCKKEFGEDVYGSDNLIDNKINNVNNNKKYYYCIKKECKNNEVIFTITVFYDFNLPVLGQIYKYQVKGQTHYISNAIINAKKITC